MSEYLDTRDLNKRLEELEEEKADLESEEMDDTNVEIDEAKRILKEWNEENGDELRELQEMRDEVSEWEDGNTLIPEGDFVDYCEELVNDIGDIPRNMPSYIVIDWEATAENIKQDYSEIEYQGEIYLYRCN